MKMNYSILLLLLFGCQNQSNVNGKYESFWGETYFALELLPKNKYKYKIEGHLAFDNLEGEYSISKDTLILKGQGLNGFYNKFVLLENDCLMEVETRFEYCKRKSKTWDTKHYPIKSPVN